MSKAPAAHSVVNLLVARRVGHLRREQQLSFDELAARSGVSKGMVVQIEQGRANPSITTLTKLAASLRVSVADLLREESGARAAVRVIAATDAPALWRGPKGGSATLLVGSEGPDMVELWDWVLCPGEKYDSRPHPAGTVELLKVLDGTLLLEVAGASHRLAAGFCAAVRADRPHAYRCQGRVRTHFSMVVHEPPFRSDPP